MGSLDIETIRREAPPANTVDPIGESQPQKRLPKSRTTSNQISNELRASAEAYRVQASINQRVTLNAAQLAAENLSVEEPKTINKTLGLTDRQLGDIATKAQLPQVLFPAPSTPVPDAAGTSRILTTVVQSLGLTNPDGTPVTALQIANASVEERVVHTTQPETRSSQFTTRRSAHSQNSSFELNASLGNIPTGLRPPDTSRPPPHDFRNVGTIIHNSVLDEAVMRSIAGSLLDGLKDPTRFSNIERDLYTAFREYNALSVNQRRLGHEMQTLEQKIRSSLILFKEVQTHLERVRTMFGSGDDIWCFMQELVNRRKPKPHATVRKTGENIVSTEPPSTGLDITREGDGARPLGGAEPHTPAQPPAPDVQPEQHANPRQSPLGGAGPMPHNRGNINSPHEASEAEAIEAKNTPEANEAYNLAREKAKANMGRNPDDERNTKANGRKPRGSFAIRPLAAYKLAENAGSSAHRHADGIANARAVTALASRLGSILRKFIDIEART